MATQTPNLGLTLPVGTENVSRQVINGNNTLIDTFAGGVNTAMDQMGANLGILETGDTATHAIAKGEYVTWKGASYTADAAISIGETLAATGGSKNLTACDKGIANALNSNVATLLATTTEQSGTVALADDLTKYKYLFMYVYNSDSLLIGMASVPIALFVNTETSIRYNWTSGSLYEYTYTYLSNTSLTIVVKSRYGDTVKFYGVK